MNNKKKDIADFIKSLDSIYEEYSKYKYEDFCLNSNTPICCFSHLAEEVSVNVSGIIFKIKEFIDKDADLKGIYDKSFSRLEVTVNTPALKDFLKFHNYCELKNKRVNNKYIDENDPYNTALVNLNAFPVSDWDDHNPNLNPLLWALTVLQELSDEINHKELQTSYTETIVEETSKQDIKLIYNDSTKIVIFGCNQYNLQTKSEQCALLKYLINSPNTELKPDKVALDMNISVTALNQRISRLKEEIPELKKYIPKRNKHKNSLILKLVNNQIKNVK
jgi:hypothetical protein